MRTLLLCLLPFIALAVEPEPVLTLVGADGAPRPVPRSRLLAEARDVAVPDPHYDGRTFTYRAVPFARVARELGPVPPGATLRFVATDGFVANIPASRLLGPDAEKAGPWLAIEPPGQPWDDKRPGVTGGPFYLVWARPQAAAIQGEEWPYAVTRVEVGAAVATRFPLIVPDPKDAAANRGFAVFTTNCLPCHTMNGQGDARIGPDLNLPMNPTEYFRPEVLPRYLRDPQSVRRWDGARMPPFGKVLSDAQIEDVVAYLRHMAGRKPR
jgi:mono/diheme cytochrome c family protein